MKKFLIWLFLAAMPAMAFAQLSTQPFTPVGQSVSVSAPNGSSSSSTALPAALAASTVQIYNAGTVPITWAYSRTPGGATATSTSVVVGAGATQIFSLPGGISDVAVYGLGGTATVYFQAGNGGSTGLQVIGSVTPGHCSEFANSGSVEDSGGGCGGSGSMTWPAAAGIPNYTGSSSWGTSYSASNPIPSNFVTVPTFTGDMTNSGTATTVSKVTGVSGTPTTVTFYNNTSGTGVLEAPAGVALGTLTWTLPDATGTLLYSGGPGGTPSSINLSNATVLTLPVGAINATGTASSTTFLEGDGKWATPTAAASSVTPGTTTVVGATAPCLLDNSTGTTMGCASVGTGLSLSGGTLSATASGTVTTTGTPASGNIAAFSGSTSITPATASQVLSLVNSQTCNAQTGTTYTFALTDANSCVTMANAAANTITVPANASVAFPVGTTLTVIQTGAGATTLEGAGSPVTLESAKYGSSTTQTYALAAEYSCISIQETATDTWFVSGCDYNPGGGSGTVTSVGMTVPAWLSVAGSPVTSSGTLAVTAATGQTANEVLASPNGTTGAVGLRALVGADLPPINLASTANGGVAGTLGVANGGTGATSSVTYLIDTGTAFTLGTGTGACATDSVVAAGAANGEVTCTGTTGASTLVVNLPTATHGWACSASDITQAAALPESAFTTTSATIKGSVTANDDIVIACTGF